ncbi:MAG: hypothetical protein AABX74_05180 [Nanoarchaeota archaeon]
MCHALKEAGHLEFRDRNFCQLSEKGHAYFQDYNDAEVIAAGSRLQDDIAKDEPIEEETKESQEVKPEKQEEDKDFEKKLDEPSSTKDEDDKGKADPTSTPPTGEGEEDVPVNDVKHAEEETEKSTANPIDSMGLMIKRFIGLFKGSIESSASGHAAHGTTRNS